VVAKVAATSEPQMWHAATWNEVCTVDDNKWHGSNCSSQTERGAGTICRDGPLAASAEMAHHGPEREHLRPLSYSAPADTLPLVLLPAVPKHSMLCQPFSLAMVVS
jgi:hypothetical protein